MAMDRFIEFFNESPDRQKFQAIVNGYIGDGPATLTVVDKSAEVISYTISIPGTPSDERDWLRHYPHEPTPMVFMPRTPDPDSEVATRWIEVVFDDRERTKDGCKAMIDVITRSQDAFTRAIADGLVKVLARRLDGKVITEGE